MPAFRQPFRGENFSPGGRFPPTNVAVVAAVVMVVEGDMEVVPPLFGGHQDFEKDLTEGVAFEDIGHPLEDTAELLTYT